MAQKNMIIAIVLSILITGLGLIYDGLVKRGIVSFVVALIFSLLSRTVSSLFAIIGLIWALYIIYDTYQCTNAINNNQAIPLFLTQVELE